MSWDTTFYTKKAEICTLGSFKYAYDFFEPQEVTESDINGMLNSYHGVLHVVNLETVLSILKTTDEKVYAKTM